MFPEKLNDAGLPDQHMISRSQTILTTYGGNCLEQLGCITIPCQYSNRSRRDVSIVGVEGPAILGLPDLKAFKIVTIHHAIDAAEPVKCTKDLVKMYPKQFDGIGNFKGEYHIVLDKNAQPVVHAKRKTPIQLKDEIEAELANMTQEGIIRKVEQPTDGVNSLAYSRKSNGKLRICLDPKDLNRYIKHDHHHTPTLEEITHKLSGNTVFSKMDAKHSFGLPSTPLPDVSVSTACLLVLR